MARRRSALAGCVVAATAFQHHARPRAPLTARPVVDAGVLEACAGYAALPTLFVGTGSLLLKNEAGGEPGPLEQGVAANDDGEVDLYRDTALRYAGYANEVGEAFAPLVPPAVVPFSYAVAITYVIADTVDKTRKVLGGDKYTDDATTTCALVEGVDALVWQLAASVALPGFTIHQLVAIAVALLGAADLSGTSPVVDALPTALGLATIPFIVKPLDELAEVAMDVTFRKVSGPYLESCEVKY